MYDKICKHRFLIFYVKIECENLDILYNFLFQNCFALQSVIESLSHKFIKGYEV